MAGLEARDKAPPAHGGARPEAILHELAEAGLIRDVHSWHLTVLPTNASRCDLATRVRYAAWQGGQPTLMLTVGAELHDLERRTAEFSRACPEIGCRQVFRHRAAHFEIFGTDYFRGESLESRVRTGSLSSVEAIAAVEQVVAALETTRRPSDFAAAQHEFDSIEHDLLNSPLFSGLDRIFLREVVLPTIRQGALEEPLATRWSNGDLTPSNILLGAHGELRLIDCEFAACTHFFAEERWRWRTFTSLPPEALDAPSLRADGAKVWPEALFILRQLAWVARTSGARLALEEAHQRVERLLELVPAAGASVRGSVFFSHAVRKGLDAGASAPPNSPMAQLYWSRAGDFSEVNSQRVPLQLRQEHFFRATFAAGDGTIHLRFDPAESRGYVRIESIRVTTTSHDVVSELLHVHDSWESVVLASGLRRISGGTGLCLACLDSDPILLLPPLQAEPGSVVTFEARLRFSHELDPS